MKATGIVRRIDDLGRVVIPKEIRRSIFFNDTATTEIYTLSLHDALPICRKVGDQRLSPAWTDYRRRVNYVVYDLLPYLRSGENVIGVMLGAGWYSNEESKPRPCFTAQLHLTMPDGTQQIRRTRVQDGWQCCKTPFLTQASIYIGERMDARLEEPGWTEPDFVSRWNRNRPKAGSFRCVSSRSA